MQALKNVVWAGAHEPQSMQALKNVVRAAGLLRFHYFECLVGAQPISHTQKVISGLYQARLKVEAGIAENPSALA